MVVCKIKTKDGLKEVEFMGIFQRSRVIDPSPFIGGHNGGVVSSPVAVVRIWEDGIGKFEEFELKDVIFEVEPLRVDWSSIEEGGV